MSEVGSGIAHQLGHAKVGHLGSSPGYDEHIVAGEVSVDDVCLSGDRRLLEQCREQRSI